MKRRRWLGVLLVAAGAVSHPAEGQDVLKPFRTEDGTPVRRAIPVRPPQPLPEEPVEEPPPVPSRPAATPTPVATPIRRATAVRPPRGSQATPAPRPVREESAPGAPE